MKPLCIDLFCGYGGWARGFSDAGYRVIGFDIEPKCKSHYEANGGEFVLADVRNLDGHRFAGARVIVASPPCTEFSLHGHPFHPEIKRGMPNTSMVDACWRIRKESGVPMVLENVAGAKGYIMGWKYHAGAYYLWGDVPQLPRLRFQKNHTRNPHLRALIPYPLARALAEACKP